MLKPGIFTETDEEGENATLNSKKSSQQDSIAGRARMELARSSFHAEDARETSSCHNDRDEPEDRRETAQSHKRGRRRLPDASRTLGIVRGGREKEMRARSARRRREIVEGKEDAPVWKNVPAEKKRGTLTYILTHGDQTCFPLRVRSVPWQEQRQGERITFDRPVLGGATEGRICAQEGDREKRR